jgi:uncharacterized membrane protein (UPF0127 family)
MNNYIIFANNKLKTLVAITDEDHENGLMFKTPPIPTMSFPYNKAEVRKFWMKNCPSPLDIIFCNGGKIINIYKGLPFSERMIGPSSPIDLVVETQHGLANSLGLAPGQPVSLQCSIDTIAASYSYALRKNAQRIR